MSLFPCTDINRIVRAQDRWMRFPNANDVSEDFLVDLKTGPSWHRGYFKDDLSHAQIEGTFAKLDANAVVVGHTLQSRVKSLYSRKVIAIDVKLSWDYRSGFPPRSSEGLWVQNGKAKRVLENVVVLRSSAIQSRLQGHGSVESALRSQ